ncbi:MULTISPECIES: VanY-A/VanY-F/VanY-M family D-Ala-D-Ala carboxypeptidase [Niallia]|jgi:zinc D-Ala-D-Ala carboxypeptidase|uniref:D-Ala-D-Ala carboxypeptidase VanY n=1 Tax=Niallia circulans TaxID=1397 RepID=A0A268F865_NIACI|nr:VanY-A/VanY-F/VanY-M family D-Ala-D-Ala carboxypeptidase [Niallia circulans]AYV67052.1 VanY-A/VanY-F/VanY-M family D-Ala-D-Ala carboxypeptidase [Niallia circulans]AYV70079.1 VanY-A/VanY-F/VanY-M family D-Ala-D-Ala carboxypeptidase [Niallia circulans]PAD81539.1 D-Ala-D-Ala carboxypeptidase VanY [Niallia circulans]
MKKWGCLLLLLIGVFFFFVYKESPLSDKIVIQKNSGYLDNRANDEGLRKIKISREMVFQGNLLLINKEFPVHQESIKSDVVELFRHKEWTQGFVLFDNKIKLSKEVLHKFSEMIAAAKKEGVNHFLISSGFRDFEEQNVLYHDMGADYALPAGYSEHNLGLSLDVGSTQMKMEAAPEGKWLENNAWRYGFILRYPKDKTEVTGIQYEPWHIRYVGLPHSAIMAEKDLVLEEYLAYLKEERNISITLNEKKYDVSYYPLAKTTDIHVPDNLHYELSGNNIDGVIVTVFNGETNPSQMDR